MQNVLAQTLEPTVINSSGSSLANTEISLDYNLGEIAVNSYSTSEIIITEGFLKGVFPEITGFSGLERFNLKFFPNPTSKLLNVEVHDNSKWGSIQLFHLSGIELINERLVPGEQHIQLDLSGFKEGIYYLRIISDDGSSQNSHKIIFKNQ